MIAFTFAGDSVFSKEFLPVLAPSKWNCVQSVRTRNEEASTIPLVVPRALTTWSPGWAVSGTKRAASMFPGRPRAIVEPILDPSNSMATVSPLRKPLPTTWTDVVGGPTTGARVKFGLGAAAAFAATRPKARTNASTRAAPRFWVDLAWFIDDLLGTGSGPT